MVPSGDLWWMIFATYYLKERQRRREGRMLQYKLYNSSICGLLVTIQTHCYKIVGFDWIGFDCFGMIHMHAVCSTKGSYWIGYVVLYLLLSQLLIFFDCVLLYLVIVAFPLLISSFDITYSLYYYVGDILLLLDHHHITITSYETEHERNIQRRW